MRPTAIAPPRDLTIPEPGSTTARDILSRNLGRLLRAIASIEALASPAAKHQANALGHLVRAAPPAALASALRRPTVAALVRCIDRPDLSARDERFVELLAQLAFDLAVAGALPHAVHLQRWPPRLLSIPARLAVTLPDDAGDVAIENGKVTVGGEAIDLRDPPRSSLVTRPYHAIAGEVVLATADNNPLALVEAHPDKSGNAIDLGGRSGDEWASALAAALAPVARHLPELRAEMELYVAQIVPVGYDAEKHLSASYQEVIGTIYMTLHPSKMTLAEALIHEASHNKVNALFELDQVLENAWSPLYASPVRPDPRPLHGVLLAVHAFLPVARLYERMIDAGEPEAQREDFRGRFAAIRKINREGAELLLREARPTPVGRGLLDEIRRWHEHYLAYEDHP